MSLEEVLDLTVTTVSRGPEVTTSVPAAVHVITQEDIRRSGATTLPEVLRLAPGLQVAQINGGTWAVGVRGFSDRLARSMLVLIDGRPVYSPLFAGTYWEVQNVVLGDVDRIEVVRGPGGTLWGANAVTGIINIVTSDTARTVGLAAAGGGGTTSRAFLDLRYGQRAGRWTYRLFAKALDRQPEFHESGPAFDGLRLGQAGWRADRPLRDGGTLTVQGDLYRARLGERPTVSSYDPPLATTSSLRAPLSGGNVLLRWSVPAGTGSRVQLQTYYARTDRRELPVGETSDTADLDLQHETRLGSRHHVTWGAGARVTSNRIRAVSPTAFLPNDRTDAVYSAFGQDEIEAVIGRAWITVGAKIEHNAYSGREWQPSARLLWLPHRRQTAWVSLARAVRVPSRVETDYTTASLLDPSVPLYVRLLPNPDFRPERLQATEAGYRVRAGDVAYVTVSAFYNRHRDVLSTEVLPPFAERGAADPRLIVPVMFGNGVDGRSYGAEVTADARPAPWWRWTANFSRLGIQMARKPGSLDGSQVQRYEGSSPRHQAQVQSSVDLPRGWSVDASARYSSALVFARIPSYVTASLRVAWQMTPRLELSVVGRDLTDARHLEWRSGTGLDAEIRRSVYAGFGWAVSPR